MCLASVSLIVLMAVISSDSVFDVNGAVSPEGFEYSVDGSGYVTITGYTGANEVASTPRSDILALLGDPLVLAIAGGLLVLIIIGVAVVLRRK
ncbi:MAG: hypothetical protein PHO99_02965 [Candidatus Methanomethylophilaceae archaeon]|nr:hypothetical protein [Candidatus Methanomethylophilaceae archaeon]MDD3128006.1 hypothetical protein [Candidatus Methanomethylophilaceae archaeon]MDD4119420.1 hypothetical protein [Candidatus Methanomethylophilaceae archaeon]